MDLRKWRGNTLEKNAEAGEKVLGIVWDTDKDTMSMVCSVNDRRESDPWTRRRLLGAVAVLFDPLGLISATHLPGKILLQRAWQETSEWDEPLSPQLASCVESRWGELQQVAEVRFPRWIAAQIDTPVEVHVFADASEKAFGCCLYVVVDGPVSHLVYAQTKVAPLKPLTLPRPLTHVSALLEGQPLTLVKIIGLDIWPVEVQLPDDDLEVNFTARQLTYRMRYIRRVADHLRRRWRQEYLVTLNTHHSGQSWPVQCGDVVFVMDGGRKQFWRTARVVQLFPEKDGNHRVSMIDTGGATTLRPI